MEGDEEKIKVNSDRNRNALLVYLGLTFFLWTIFNLAGGRYTGLKDMIFTLVTTAAITSILIILLWIIIEVISFILGFISNEESAFVLLFRQVCLIAFFALLISGGVCFSFILT